MLWQYKQNLEEKENQFWTPTKNYQKQKDHFKIF